MPSLQAPHFDALPPLALYVHIPWCVRKCPYCDFNSHALKKDLPERAYIDALLADLMQESDYLQGRRIDSIFIGGGTPSLCDPGSIARLLEGIRAHTSCSTALEVTMEANPGTLESGRSAEFRSAGVNRLSLGVQSFDDGLLQSLGRIHGRRTAIKAAEDAHHAGFDNFNLDVMYGLPRQTPAQAQADVAVACALEPSHISHYQLTLEPNTWFHRYPPELPHDDTIYAMQEDAQAALAARGYRQYEVSAYAKPERRCRHNVNYWLFGDYLGIGAGAHGKMTLLQDSTVLRTSKLKAPDAYMTKAASADRVHTVKLLQPADIRLEFMLNALRLNDGFERELYSARTGLAWDSVLAAVTIAEGQGLLETQGDRVRATALGRRFLNDVLMLFMPEEENAYA